MPKLAATIGEGDEAVGVAGNGAVVRWLPLPEEPPLPRLPLDEVPKGGRVRGPALEQVRVLAAVPDALRPYVAGSYFGESGVDVELTTGIELRFGDATQAAAEVARGGRDPRRSLGDRARLCRPARPQPPVLRRLRTRTSAPTLNHFSEPGKGFAERRRKVST